MTTEPQISPDLSDIDKRALIGINPDGEKRLARWRDSVAQLDRYRAHLLNAETEEMLNRKSLGEFFTPEDAKPGEVFNVWLGSMLVVIEVPKTGVSTYTITVRKGGRVK